MKGLLVPTQQATRSELAASYAIEHLGFPHDWRSHRIAMASEHVSGPKADGAAVLTTGGVPFLFILVADTSPHEAEEVASACLLESRFAAVAIVLDLESRPIVCLRRRFDRNECDRADELDPRAFGREGDRLLPFIRGGKRGAVGRCLVPLTERVENLLFELHSDLRDIDGLHADAALDELCKLILLKTADEMATEPGSPARLQRWLYACDDELATVARTLHEDLVPQFVGDGRATTRHAPASVLASPFVMSNAALTRLIEQLEPFTLTDSDLDLKARAFQRVLSPSIRAGMGQYFTPLPVIRFMVDVVAPQENERILDPFAGSGHFLASAHSSMCGESAAPRRERGTKLHAIEKSDRMVRVAMADMLMHGSVHTQFHCNDSLLPFRSLNAFEPESFDIVLTNPPFGSLLRNGAIARLGPFTIAHGRKSAPLEVLGVERCVEFLRPGGRLAIVLPDGLLANPGSAYVRQWVLKRALPRVIVSLPIETFAPFGANVKTSILFCRKLLPGEEPPNETKVFFGASHDVGYDAAGRESDQCDLHDLADKIRSFLTEEGW